MSHPTESGRRAALVVSILAGATTLVWAVAAVLMSRRGFDFTDEGLYLLSYRWWNDDLRSFSGTQYVYGPVFQLFGYDVGALRIFRLVTVLGTHAVFGWAFMTWLRTRRPEALASWHWELAGTMVVVAAGGISYCWLPLSPGYNDVVALGSLLMAAAVLRSMRAVALGRRLPVLPALALGPLAIAMVLAKWSAGATLLFLTVLAVVGFAALGARGWWRYIAATAAGLVGTALLVEIALVSFTDMLPPMLELNRAVAASSHDPMTILETYWTHGVRMMTRAGKIAGVAVVVAGAGYALRRLGLRRTGAVVGLVGPAAGMVAASPDTLGFPGSGPLQLPELTSALVGPCFAVAVVVVLRTTLLRARTTLRGGDGWRTTLPAAVTIVMLLLLPAVQAAGTSNALHYLAIQVYAAWVALLVAAVTALPPASSTRLLAAGAVACAVIGSSAVGAHALLENPYRTSGYAESTTPIGGDGPAASVKVAPEVADALEELRAIVGDEATTGRPMMAFDGHPGVVFLLGGRSVGEGWYSGRDLARTATGIRVACADGNPWGDQQPLVLYYRSASTIERAAMRKCGLHFPRDFRLLGRVGGPGGLPLVYVHDPSGRS